MSNENVEIVRRTYEAFVRGDAATALAAYSEDTEWDDRHFRPEGRVHCGREELVEVIRTWVGAWRDYSFSIKRVIDAGDHVVVISEDRGKGKGSGIEINTLLGFVVDVAGGQITRTVVYADPAEALKAAGLKE
jgi:ketosteroid isomerase-like protein